MARAKKTDAQRLAETHERVAAANALNAGLLRSLQEANREKGILEDKLEALERRHDRLLQKVANAANSTSRMLGAVGAIQAICADAQKHAALTMASAAVDEAPTFGLDTLGALRGAMRAAAVAEPEHLNDALRR